MSNDMSRGVAMFVGIGVVVVASAFGVGAFLGNARAVVERFPKGFVVAGVDIGEKTKTEALRLLKNRFAVLEKQGFAVTMPGYGVHVLPVVVNGERLFAIDSEKTIEIAERAIGRQRWIIAIKSIVGLDTSIGVEQELIVSSRVNELVSDAIEAWKLPLPNPQPARFEIAHDGSFAVKPSVAGMNIDIDLLIRDAEKRARMNQTMLSADVREEDPIVSTRSAEALVSSARMIVPTSTRELALESARMPLQPKIIASMIQPVEQDGKVVLGIDSGDLQKAASAAFIKFEKKSSDAIFERNDQRVTKFVPSVSGVAIDWKKTSEDLFSSVSNIDYPGGAAVKIIVATTTVQPLVTTEKSNDLGIKEIVGVGRSNFAGSPANRRHNILTGIKSLDGILIAPGETFSLIKALGRIDATTGYREELVIKDNKTTPEFGGGLCQVGTTTFRTVMGAGLPVLERQNHSYQVRYYYENGVSGTDATIYDPKPDFKFLNDTGNWLMLETTMKGDDLEFRLWGTSDGRASERTIPKISNVTPPPEKKIIETVDIPVGTTKCTEKPHAGATATFTYTVTYANGTVQKKDFVSRYRPWQEVCLVGVAVSSTIAVTPDGLTDVPSPDAAGVAGN